MTDHTVLSSERHRELRVRLEPGADRGDAVMCCLTIPDEFRQVAAEYPILFRLDAERTGFSALAMFGFENGENLFLKGDRWDARYRPLVIAIQPFLIGQAAPGSEDRQVHVDMASPRLVESGSGSQGMRIFDEHGLATPYLEGVVERLGALDAGYRASPAFFAAIERHGLLEPMTFDVTLDDGVRHSLIGFHIIDEDRLRDLDDAAIAELHRDGHLMPIFMAVASLGHLPALIARKNRRSGHG